MLRCLNQQLLDGLLQALDLSLQLAALVRGDRSSDDLQWQGQPASAHDAYMARHRKHITNTENDQTNAVCMTGLAVERNSPGETHRRRGPGQPLRERTRRARSAQQYRELFFVPVDTLNSAFA